MNPLLLDPNRFTVQAQKGSLWSDTLELILTKLNPHRIADGYPPLTFGRIARELKKAGIDSGEKARTLYDQCNDPEVRSFSRMFWYKIKTMYEKQGASEELSTNL